MTTTHKCTAANSFYTRGQCNSLKTAAILESLISYISYVVGDGDRCQAAAIKEGRAADACHTLWNVNGNQATTTIKSIVSDAGHAIGNSDRG